MKLILAIFLASLVVATSSCSEQKKSLSFYDTSEVENDTVEMNKELPDTTSVSNQVSYKMETSSEEVTVPFVDQSGMKLIDVTVNRQLTVKMILDSGCSTTLISIAEVRYLYEKGCITQDDFLGTAKSQIADGSIVEDMVINLREVIIGGKICCTNVIATVSANAQAPLLLGNEVLNRVPAYYVDNEEKVIKFKLE
jgi:hypothetical protein